MCVHLAVQQVLCVPGLPYLDCPSLPSRPEVLMRINTHSLVMILHLLRLVLSVCFSTNTVTHLGHPAGHSLHYCLGIPAAPMAPALPEVLETPVGPALPAARERCGSTPADWECGSEWNCTAPCDLRPKRERETSDTRTQSQHAVRLRLCTHSGSAAHTLVWL